MDAADSSKQNENAQAPRKATPALSHFLGLAHNSKGSPGASSSWDTWKFLDREGHTAPRPRPTACDLHVNYLPQEAQGYAEV